MQSSDGGWAAFDVDNNWYPLSEVPFADHNAMLDPTCPDITGRVVECLSRRGMTGHDAVKRGAAYLLEWWDTYQTNRSRAVTARESIQAGSDGSISIPISNLRSDVAIKIDKR